MQELIVNLHGVGAAPSWVHPMELNYWLDNEEFYRLLDWICVARNDMTIPFVITFDDGNISDALVALPALIKRNLKAKFFICAGRIGSPNYLDRSAILDLVDAGMDVGSHGMNHVNWRKTSSAELKTEIAGARRKLEDVSGRVLQEVAIPFGSYGRREIAELKKEGFFHVFTSDGGYAWTDSWLKPRNSVDRSWESRNVITEINARQMWKQAFGVLQKYYKLLR